MGRVRRRWLWGSCGLTVIVVAAALAGDHWSCTEVSGNDRISVPVASLLRGQAAFFCYRDRTGERLRFILARDDAGELHSVLDACRTCGRYHRGYRAADGELICHYCGNHYRLSELERGKASCVPVRLPSTERSNAVEVRVADLEKGQTQF